MTEVIMPRLSDTMEEGTIIAWLKADGDSIAVGDEIVEIETDKANMSHEADAEGVLSIVVPEGETIPVGQVMATIGDGSAPVPVKAPAAEETEAEAETVDATATAETVQRPDVHVKASPLARRMAADLGIELTQVSGSGPNGRIVKEDISSALNSDPGAEPAAPAPAAGGSARPEGTAARGELTRVELTRLQKVIAGRMVEAKSTVPEFQVQAEVDMTEALRFRAGLKEMATEEDTVPSLNDLVVKAAAIALRRFPRANGSFREDGFDLHGRVNVGVAVAGEDSLVVPTVFDADEKSLGAIAQEVRRLAGRVRSGEVSPAELDGATFTVSNLGMFGVSGMTPVINPPQAAILGVGSSREVLVRRDGAIVESQLMNLTLTCDHRILYGAEAAEFLVAIKKLLEAPMRLNL